MLWIAKATFSLSALRTAHRLTEYPRHYCGHREQDFDEDIEDENAPFDIVAAADASGNAKRQLIISRYFA